MAGKLRSQRSVVELTYVVLQLLQLTRLAKVLHCLHVLAHPPRCNKVFLCGTRSVTHIVYREARIVTPRNMQRILKNKRQLWLLRNRQQ